MTPEHSKTATADHGPQSIDRWLHLWAETRGGAAALINISENQTFRIDSSDRGRHILRVHRAGYQSDAAIESELAWVKALAANTGLPVPRPLPGMDGALLQSVRLNGAPQRAVLFAFEPGREPQPDEDLRAHFKTLGRIAAQTHAHVEQWRPPHWFERPTWNAASILDPGGLWGDWRTAPGVDGSNRAILDRLDARLRAELAAYGQSAGVFGLIHADMRLANLLIDGNRIVLIDFDDCGFCWFMYDFAAAVSFFEDSPAIPALKASWVAGYGQLRALSDVDLAAIDTMVMLRRMALLAWIGSHRDTDLALQHAPRFAAVSAQLATDYLQS
ncbi:MAG: phosphotransferase [Hyphomicrobiales bacterium]|nr:phosphotransferase [Hyphomicrobiales bacterium]